MQKMRQGDYNHEYNIGQGRGAFLELGHLDKHSLTTQERKAPQGKNLHFFCLETLKKIAF